MGKKNQNTLTIYIVLVFVLVGSVFGISWLLRTQELSSPVKLALAVIPVAAFAILIIMQLRLIRQTDELQQRILLEALAIAFPSVAVAVLMYEYLRKAGFIPHIMPDDVLIVMIGSFLIGYLISWRRYR